MIDLDELKKDFLDEEFDSKEFRLDAEKVVIAAVASGETRSCFVDANDPNFQATPAFLCSMASGRHLPIDFPSVGGLPMDGGKAVTCHASVPCGETITGKTRLHEIYDKKGRSGRMIFVVARMELFNSDETHLATMDSRLVIREKPAS